MAYDGNGNFSRPVAAYVFDTIISETDMNTEMDGIATGLSTAITKDGQTTVTANLPMATFRHTGVGNATARTDYAAAGQVQDGALVWAGTAGGTANALTLSLSPAITAYATNMRIGFKASANANTGSATVAVNGLAAKAIEADDSALSAGDIAANKYYEIYYDGTAFQLTRLGTGNAGTGDVVGPGSAVDSNIASYDGVTGKLIKDSGVATSDIVTASSTTTFTNKTFDANGTGNSLSNVDVADLANGTDGELITWDAAGAPATVGVGTSGQILTSNGAGAAPTFQDATSSGLTLGTPQASTSGTAIDFTGIPSGTKQIIISLNAVSESGGNNLFVQLGDSGGFETTGYSGAYFAEGVGSVALSTSFLTAGDTAAATRSGAFILTLENSSNNTWSCAAVLGSTFPRAYMVGGIKSLSSELTQVRIGVSAGVFDAGEINISYQ